MSVSPDTGMIRGPRRVQGPQQHGKDWQEGGRLLAVTEAYTVSVTQFLALKA